MPLKIAAKASVFVKELLGQKLPADMHFHNLSHTEDVVDSATEIAMNTKLLPWEIEVLQVGAWFHDTGYCFAYLNHEAYSIDTAIKFLLSRRADQTFIKTVEQLINATRFPQRPKTLMEQILCDADLAHLAKPNYLTYEQRLRNEWQFKLNKTYTDAAWRQLNINLLSNHIYFTPYAKEVLQPLKQQNIQILKGLE